SLLALASTASHFALAQEASVLTEPGAAKYEPVPFPPGAQQATIVGDPKAAGGYVLRIKLGKGTKVPPHMHPNDENVTVISGSFHFGVGEKFDEGKGQALKAGGFVSFPKGLAHYAWTSEDSIIQLHGVGPAGVAFVNPADDPRKK